MDGCQIDAIDANMKDLLDSLVPSTPIFILYCEVHKVISFDEKEIVKREPISRGQLTKLIAILKNKDSAWKVMEEFLKDNNQAQLAERLRKSAEHFPTNTAVSQSNLQRPDVENSETAADQSGETQSLQTKETEATEMLVATLKEKSKLQPFAQLLPNVLTLMRTYPTTTKVKLECIRLIQPVLTHNLSDLSVEAKTDLFETLLTCLQTHSEEELITECANTLAKLDIFDDPTDKYTKTVESLLKIISNPEMTITTKRSTMCLLSVITQTFCRSAVTGWKKWFPVWNLLVVESEEIYSWFTSDRPQVAFVEQICEVIRQQLNNPTYDRILQFSWCCLENLCGSPDTAHKFLYVGGAEMFNLIYGKFGDEVEMVEKMMRMMSTISCIPSIRAKLPTKRNFEVFWKIWVKHGSNVTISLWSVRFFDNFMSDSTLIWPLDSPTVEEAKNILIETINKWKLDAQTNFRPSTLETLLFPLRIRSDYSMVDRMLRIYLCANLTTIDASKYCRMLRDEGGVEILTTEVIRHPKSSQDAIRLARVAVKNVTQWESTAIQH